MVTVEVEIHDLKEDLLKTPLDAVDRIVAEAYAEHTNNLKSDRTGETTLAGAITGN